MNEDQSPSAATLDEDQTPKVAASVLKKPDLIQRVVDKTGKKQAEVKPVVEAALEVLAEAMQAGENLQLPPLGRVKVNKVKPVANGSVLSLRLRMNDGGSDD